MHGGELFLGTLALVLCVAALTTVAFQRLGQPVVLGYLLAGMLVGAHSPLPLSADASTVRTLSELGIILVMFSLGLDFSLRRLLRRAAPAIVAVIETSIMFGLGSMAAALLGWSGLARLTAGAMVAISSTTIVAKAFGERHVPKPRRELAFGILIGEDLIAIAALAVLTAAASGAGASAAKITAVVWRLGGFLIVVIGLGMLFVPRLVRAVVRLQRPETTVVASVGLCFALALLAHAAGYSVALGAFLAGALIGESGVERHVEQLIRPLRDLFAAVFFVSVGMLIEPGLIAQHAGAVALFLAVVLIGKVASVGVAAFLTGHGIRPAIEAGMSLAQIGEFSFILVGVGITQGVVPEAAYPIAVAVCAATTLLTPWLIAASDETAAFIDRHLPKAMQTFAALHGSWIEQLRAAPRGSGAWAAVRRRLAPLALDAAVLAALAISLALEGRGIAAWLAAAAALSPRTAQALVGLGGALVALPFLVGLLRSTHALGIAIGSAALPQPPDQRVDLADAPRRALAVALQLTLLLLIGAPLVAITQPFISPYLGAAALLLVLTGLGVSLWRRATNLQAHAKAAAQLIVEVLAKQARGAPANADTLAPMRDLLPGLGTPIAVRLTATSHGVGKTLSALNLRGLTGATVLAIVRGADGVLVPSGKDVLRAGDLLALAGPHAAIEAAYDLLLGDPRQSAPGAQATDGPDGRSPEPN